MKGKILTYLIGLLVLLTGVSETYKIIPEKLSVFDGQNLQVKTSNGPVKGFLATTCRSQMKFVGFRGIPYAKPPLGELRFKDPVEIGDWEGVYDATYQRSGCMQGSFDNTPSDDLNKNFSEDCLYLNVYTPNLNYLRNKKAPLKSVMVYIHGGAFLLGSSYENELGPDFLVDKDVVLVTFNYRLGAFGFLSLQNAEVPGNAGLKDQHLALKWVKKNIEAFGGDPDKITIFGESAGSASVNYHLLFKESTGLFRSAIMESGSALSSWAYSTPDEALQKAKKLGNHLNCKKSNDGTKLLQCLQSISAETISISQQQVLTIKDLASMNIIAFQPTMEPNVPGAFLTGKPFDLLSSGNFIKVPTIIGFNSNEGLLVYPALQNNTLTNLLLPLLGMDLSRLAPAHLDLRPMSSIATKVHKAIMKAYFNDKGLNKNEIFKLLELVGDVNFVVPIEKTAYFIAKYSPHPVYNYYFTYDGGYGIFKALANIKSAPGVSHADELGYLFYTREFHMNCDGNTTKAPVEDELTLDRMTKLWTNFANTNDPTPNLERLIPNKWEPFTSSDQNYLNIGADLIPSTKLKLETLQFWNEIYKITKNSRGKKD